MNFYFITLFVFTFGFAPIAEENDDVFSTRGWTYVQDSG